MGTKFRPECGTAKPGEKLTRLTDDDALYRIRDAVRDAAGLGFGALYDKTTGKHCAIGAFWERNPRTTLRPELIDEVASYNDSIPRHLSPRTRRNRVLAWLNYRLDVLRGKTPKPPKKPLVPLDAPAPK